MNDNLFEKIENEIEKLQYSNHRKDEKVWADEKQLKHLKKLFISAKSLKYEYLLDFSRFVSDISSINSKIFKLTRELMSLVEEKG